MFSDNKYTVISLFSGCGGLDLGIEGGFKYLGSYFDKNPFKTIWANDINERACATFKLNFPEAEVICDDIVNVLRHRMDLPKADVVVGGFPCQDFSLAGKRLGMDVGRGRLYLSLAETVRLVQPKVFIAENVKGLLSWNGGLGIETMISDFERLGYEVEYKLFNMADYGVPQVRQRVIIMGVRKDLDSRVLWPEATHSREGLGDRLPWLTAREAIEDLERDRKHFCLPNSSFSYAKLSSGTQGNSVMNGDLPSPTVRAEHHGNIDFHYKKQRRVSAREAARFQSFPDDFVFVKSMTDAYRQVGNAVSPVFAWHLARSIEKMIASEISNKSMIDRELVLKV